MENDIYVDMDRAEYDSIRALNQSTIKTCYSSSLAHGVYDLSHPSPPTDDMIVGKALHALVLEPEHFNERFAPMPVNAAGHRLPRSTRAGELAWDLYDDEHRDKHPIKPAKFEEMKAIRESILTHPIAREMIENSAIREASFFWEHPRYDFACKGQLDLLTSFQGWSWCVDLKSTKDASQDGFSLEIARYSYMIQRAWYLEGLNEIAEADRRFAFICFEKKPPYGVSVQEMDAENALEGQYRCDTIARKWAQAMEDGKFRGYPAEITQTRGIRWAMTHERIYDENEEGPA